MIVIRSCTLSLSSTTVKMHGLLRRRRSSACLLVSSRHSRSVVLSLFTSGHEVLEDCSHLLLQLGDKAGWSRP